MPRTWQSQETSGAEAWYSVPTRAGAPGEVTRPRHWFFSDPNLPVSGVWDVGAPADSLSPASTCVYPRTSGTTTPMGVQLVTCWL
ncbi:hypothetical protein H8959_005226 [Pygathrix nigripes]